MQFHKISVPQVMIFTLYTVCNKNEMIKIGNQTRKKFASIFASARIILLPTVQSAAKLFEYLGYVVSKNSYFMQFHEINICEVMIFRP